MFKKGVFAFDWQLTVKAQAASYGDPEVPVTSTNHSNAEMYLKSQKYGKINN